MTWFLSWLGLSVVAAAIFAVVSSIRETRD